MMMDISSKYFHDNDADDGNKYNNVDNNTHDGDCDGENNADDNNTERCTSLFFKPFIAM